MFFLIYKLRPKNDMNLFFNGVKGVEGVLGD